VRAPSDRRTARSRDTNWVVESHVWFNVYHRVGRTSKSRIVVVDYDPRWPEIFEQLRLPIWSVVREFATTVEHVGSTAVPGLSAKPIVDISVVVPSHAKIPIAIERLAGLGYVHQGNLGVEGREAFITPGPSPAYHLYLCPTDSLALANHLTIRDYLRAHPDVADEYGALKERLARRFPQDIDSYIAGKTDLILRILQQAGIPPADRETIARINRRSV
jgi:GrpB-like predicted nucleotidyltransferase (UPF0157 family)